MNVISTSKTHDQNEIGRMVNMLARLTEKLHDVLLIPSQKKPGNSLGYLGKSMKELLCSD